MPYISTESYSIPEFTRSLTSDVLEGTYKVWLFDIPYL